MKTLGYEKGIPFIGSREEWSIGIYEGLSPLDLAPAEALNNPILTAKDVTDVEAAFVADPFVIAHENHFYMFFEVLNRQTKQGDIGLAQSADGRFWEYQNIVLDEPFHLSYPQVFYWENAFYMIPESYEDQSIKLYRASQFPRDWHFVATLLSGSDFVDPTILHHQDKWWLFHVPYSSDHLFLHYANHLLGPWHEHPASPVIQNDPNIARPAGKIIAVSGRLFRIAQDDYPHYGEAVHAFEIIRLSPEHYQETPLPKNPILSATGKGWNSVGMHHLDAFFVDGIWLAAVDGLQRKRAFGLAY